MRYARVPVCIRLYMPKYACEYESIGLCMNCITSLAEALVHAHEVILLMYHDENVIE